MITINLKENMMSSRMQEVMSLLAEMRDAAEDANAWLEVALDNEDYPASAHNALARSRGVAERVRERMDEWIGLSQKE